ncbi:hypothetical protein DY000_02023194 [Brassica cretica]|uniref:Uncharacterized protein n=1 Tax=Brassica cretica TaxID=69181 RepID=A0ABQ7E2Z9_BRACR|nr:hypothetical protein DY000_02023194 [Brassica cretica]
MALTLQGFEFLHTTAMVSFPATTETISLALEANSSEAIQILDQVLEDPSSSPEDLRIKEQAITNLCERLTKEKRGQDRENRQTDHRCHGKDTLNNWSPDHSLQRDGEWTRAEKRTFLRQRVEARLAALLMENKGYVEALALLSTLVKELKLYDGEDEPQGLQMAMKVDLRSVAFCGDSSTTNEARVMHRLFAVTVGASRYGRAERGGVMRRRCFNDESAVSSKLQTKQHIEGTKHANIRILTTVALELKLYDGEDEPQGLQTAMKVDLRSVAFCGDSSTTNEARVMHRLFAVTVGASRYGRAERGGVMRRRCFNDESAALSSQAHTLPLFLSLFKMAKDVSIELEYVYGTELSLRQYRT